MAWTPKPVLLTRKSTETWANQRVFMHARAQACMFAGVHACERAHLHTWAGCVRERVGSVQSA